LLTFCRRKNPTIGASYQLGCLRSKAGAHEKMVHSRNWSRGAADLERRHGTRRHRRGYWHSGRRDSRAGVCRAATGICCAAPAGVLPTRAGISPALRVPGAGVLLRGPPWRPPPPPQQALETRPRPSSPPRSLTRPDTSVLGRHGAARFSQAVPWAAFFLAGLVSRDDPPSFQRAGRWATAGGSGRRRGAPGACHQPLCGRMRKLGFTIESHSVDAFEDLQAALLGFAACCERLLARYSPAFLGCVAADAAGPDSNL